MKYILAISISLLLGATDMSACGPYYPDDPDYICMFRSCSPELEQQWWDGCRFQDYEKYENCVLWQNLALKTIPLKDIEKVIYDSTSSDLQKLTGSVNPDNKFAVWLSSPKHKDDLEYVLVAKEIEEIRSYMNDPWYYGYDGDEEHQRLDALLKRCEKYNGERHADRYALQLMRLYFAKDDYSSCIDLWETRGSKMPQNIVTDMMASYAGGAYFRKGNRDKAIELYTRSQDIGSLINLNVWKNSEDKSKYKDSRIKELEYIFNRFPNSPLLSVKLQKYVRNREEFISEYEREKEMNKDDIVDFWFADDDKAFNDELKCFAKNTLSSTTCRQKGMWLYALAYLSYLDGDIRGASSQLSRAEKSEATPFIKESIKAFRILLDVHCMNMADYKAKLLSDLEWLDNCMQRDFKLTAKDDWQYSNRMNRKFYYWQDVARKVFLGDACSRLKTSGETTLALQLANFATNYLYQLSPLMMVYYYEWDNNFSFESYKKVMTVTDYRNIWDGFNYFDYNSDFFKKICDGSAVEAVDYVNRIIKPEINLDRFLNERSYVDKDYLCDIVGTLYLREMNYKEAVKWLSKVSKDYQERTNLSKEGFFKLDPFQYQFDKKHYIKDSSDYKLKFAQEMLQLERKIKNEDDVNLKANAKIRYAIGLRNSFGRCWYLTQYGYSRDYLDGEYNYSYIGAPESRDSFNGNYHAQEAYRKADRLVAEALSEYTNPEQAAIAQLEMMNYATVMKKYPMTQTANYIRSRCDNYYDYCLQKR